MRGSTRRKTMDGRLDLVDDKGVASGVRLDWVSLMRLSIRSSVTCRGLSQGHHTHVPCTVAFVCFDPVRFPEANEREGFPPGG